MATTAARVVICSQNDQVRRVLEITGLELSIPVHTTRDEALAALAAEFRRFRLKVQLSHS